MSMWVGAIITGVLTGLAVFASIRVERKAAALQMATEAEAEYRVHWVIAVLAWIDVLLALWIFLQGRGRGRDVVCFYLVIGSPIFLLGIGGLFCCLRARVVFRGGQLIFQDGLRTHTCHLKEVQGVWVANGLMTVDCGRIPRLTILHIFSNSAEILARLQQAAQENRMQPMSS